MIKPKFIKTGFEFTASAKLKGKVKSTELVSSSHSGLIYRKYDRQNEPISKHSWINKNFQSDDCGCEIPTPIVNNKKEVITYFKQFKRFVVSHNLTINIADAKCGGGGCHIHKDISFMTPSQKKLFIKNVGVFFINYPELNWGFNDVNDNINANSLLNDYSSYEKSNYMSHNINIAFIDHNDLLYPYNNNNPIVKKFGYDNNPINLFLAYPTKLILKKRFAMKYNKDYKTVEFRIFDMPKTLNQHLLHDDVATAIYNYCYKLTMKKQLLKLEYTKFSDYKFSVKNSITRFNKVMDLLKISKRRTSAMRFNILTRYEWSIKSSKEHYLF